MSPKISAKAIHYFKLAAKQGCAEAQFILGNIYISNQYVTRDVNKAIEYYSLAANQNHSEALFKLGSLYYFNQDIPRDINKFFSSKTRKKNSFLCEKVLGQLNAKNDYINLLKTLKISFSN